jgi:beta-1,4-mannosyl-glycoprotein beta-1,4-N-acetylglucosaminyltransferase
VEKFVISEANITFSGRPKQLNFFERRSEFSRWIKKIEYLPFVPPVAGLKFEAPTSYDPNNAAWKVEISQRDALFAPLRTLSEDVLIVVTDLDEIWNPATLRNLKPSGFVAARLEMGFYYFFMNCRGVGAGNSSWAYPFCILSSFMKTEEDSAGFSRIRTKAQLPLIPNAGWHFSYLGGVQAAIEKIESFSHQELNKENIKNPRRIENCINLGLDPFGRPDHLWEFVDTNDFPLEISHLMRQYPEFLKVITSH